MTELATAVEPRVLAAVDLGSNSFHMVVAQCEDGHLRMLDRLRDMVRIAGGLDENQLLTDVAEDRALECLARFGERIRYFHAANVSAVGTNALRKARNTGDFLARAELALGHPIDIISGREEARLIFLGATKSVAPVDGGQLVLDIGGGSTEVVLGDRGEPDQLFSLFIGCVGLSEAYFSGGALKKKKLAAARLTVDSELDPIVAPLKEQGWDQVLGCSGTIRVVCQMLHEIDPTAHGIGAKGLKRLIEQMLKYPNIADVPLNSLDDRRRPVLMGGLVILERLFERLKIANLRVADGALREGLLYELAGGDIDDDAQARSVRMLQQKYQIDRNQADRVLQLLDSFLEQSADALRLQKTGLQRLLRAAAQVHEIGLSIAHSHYHRHGAYILGNADLPGFSRQEQIILAWFVGGHRRRAPDPPHERLRRGYVKRMPRLLALLRLVVLLLRARREADLPSIKLKWRGAELQLEFPNGWLQDHPLTAADLKTEVQKQSVLGVELSCR